MFDTIYAAYLQLNSETQSVFRDYLDVLCAIS